MMKPYTMADLIDALQRSLQVARTKIHNQAQTLAAMHRSVDVARVRELEAALASERRGNGTRALRAELRDAYDEISRLAPLCDEAVFEARSQRARADDLEKRLAANLTDKVRTIEESDVNTGSLQ